MAQRARRSNVVEFACKVIEVDGCLRKTRLHVMGMDAVRCLCWRLLGFSPRCDSAKSQTSHAVLRKFTDWRTIGSVPAPRNIRTDEDNVKGEEHKK